MDSLVGTGNLDKAAIFNAEGTSVWASSPGFQVCQPNIEHESCGDGLGMRICPCRANPYTDGMAGNIPG